MGSLDASWTIVALSMGSFVIGVLGASLVAVYHRRDMKKLMAKEVQLESSRQDEIKQEQLYQAGQRIVNSVNSNNNSPRLGDKLAHLSLRLEQLGMELNVNVNGCVENARR